MSAIDIHIGTQAKVDRDAPTVCTVGGSPAEATLAAARACVPELANTHNGLERMLGIRRALEDRLIGRRLGVTDGQTLGLTGSQARRLYFTIDPPYEQNEIAWMPSAVKSLRYTAMIGEAGKMACPTWDLPAGSPLVGGACPGATEGQSVIPLAIRRKTAEAVGLTVHLDQTICQLCYASGGQYASPHVQFAELVRYWWTRDMLDNPDTVPLWIDTVVRAIQGEAFPVERSIDPRTGAPLQPMRVHSSGDFFSPTYARAWVEICNRLPEKLFWAPTRTWAAPGWNEHWARLVPLLQHRNLVLRPSAYHTGDPAPAAADHPWPGPYPYTSAGTTALYKFDDAGAVNGVSRDPRYDWACQTYAIVDEAHSCPKARAPDGQLGCRACWIRPDLRVNYAAH